MQSFVSIKYFTKAFEARKFNVFGWTSNTTVSKVVTHKSSSIFLLLWKKNKKDILILGRTVKRPGQGNVPWPELYVFVSLLVLFLSLSAPPSSTTTSNLNFFSSLSIFLKVFTKC